VCVCVCLCVCVRMCVCVYNIYIYIYIYIYIACVCVCVCITQTHTLSLSLSLSLSHTHTHTGGAPCMARRALWESNVRAMSQNKALSCSRTGPSWPGGRWTGPLRRGGADRVAFAGMLLSGASDILPPSIKPACCLAISRCDFSMGSYFW
jgi:hypothetical protein